VSGLPAAATAAGSDADTRELVFTLHGLARTRLSMAWLARSLEREGYRVVNWGYRSSTATVAEFGRALADEVARQAGEAPRIHFVGHSLGNIVVRWMLAHAPPPRPGRVVMLAPPNQGSRAADRYARWLGRLLRPLPELRTAADSTARTLPRSAGTEIGIIAGRFDAKVSVAESHLAEATASLVVPAAHTFVMNRRDVRGLVLRFLRTGSFEAPAVG